MIKPFTKASVDYLKSYKYKLRNSKTQTEVANKGQLSPALNAIMFVIGISGIPVAFFGNYQLGIVFLLMLFFPIIRWVNGTPQKIMFNYLNQQLQGVDLDKIHLFKFTEEESLAYATAFEEGTVEHTLNLMMVRKDGVEMKLFSFTNRKKEKPGATLLLNEMNTWLD